MRHFNNVLTILLFAAAFCAGWVLNDCTDGKTDVLILDSSLSSFEAGDVEAQAEASLVDFKDLLDAIEWIESEGNLFAVGDGGKAVGAFQIHPIMVRDVNRILGHDKYSQKDRWSKAKSREICTIYLNHYCKNKSYEYMARSWNGGPTGWKKDSTEKYWLKVQKRLEQI